MKYLLLFISFILAAITPKAQDSSLLKLLDDSMSTDRQVKYVSATFKANHIINTQTIEAPAKGILLFMIMHRFGEIKDGAYQLYGLDNATMRIGLDYGITDRLTAGTGRSTYQKTFDGYFKYKLLRQTEGTGRIPLSVSVLGSIAHNTLKYTGKDYLNATYRTTYTTQLLIARKFNRNFSLQLAPSLIHYNLVPETIDKNDVFVLGTGGRMKITKRMSINVEYDCLFPGQVNSYRTYNSLSAGIDIETGGHVFQLHVTNSQGMVEPLFLGNTTGSWGKGNIFFGFNISRAFNLRGKK